MGRVRMGWGVLGAYEWIGISGRRVTIPFYDICYLKGNSSLVHETIIPINLIKLTKNKYKYCNCSKQKLRLHSRYYLTTIFTVGLIHKERKEGANHTQLTIRFVTCQRHLPQSKTR